MYIWTDGPLPDQCRNCGWTPEQHGPGRACPTIRTPLRTEQHILHLLLTVFTFGLWGIVWAVKAGTGNHVLNMAPSNWKPPPVDQRRPGAAPGG